MSHPEKLGPITLKFIILYAIMIAFVFAFAYFISKLFKMDVTGQENKWF